GQGGGFSPFGGPPEPRGPSRGEDLTTKISISLPDAVRGTELPLVIDRPGRCSKCKGSGELGKPSKCPTCNGTGRTRSRGPFASTCPTCGGTGKVAPPCDQ